MLPFKGSAGDLELPLPPDEVDERHRRIAAYLHEVGADAMVLTRRDNFAWASGGGNATVISSTADSVGVLVFVGDKRFLIAQSMDGQRLMDEELAGQGYELIERRWYEATPLETAVDMLKGKRVVADVAYPGWDSLDWIRLHYPLTAGEVARARWLGSAVDELMVEVAQECRPGMSEREIAANLLAAAAIRGMDVGVLIVAADDRIARYRHPMPTARRLERTLLLHVAASRWGIHCNVSRMIHFGPIPADLQKRYEAANRVQAIALAFSQPGVLFSDILARMKAEYKLTGFPDEWRGHYQGALTGYRLADPDIMKRPKARVPSGAAFDWFITITGVKVEEVAILTPDGPEVVSVTGKWPTVPVPSPLGDYQLAAIWER